MVVGNLLWGSLEEFSFVRYDGISQTFVKVTFIKLKIFMYCINLKSTIQNIEIHNKNNKEICTLMAKLAIFKKHTVFNLLLLTTILKFENLTYTGGLSTQLALILANLYFMRLNIF